MNSPPKLRVFAGPNGSGKSTITENFQQLPNSPENYINPDEIALNLPGGNTVSNAYTAATIAENQRSQFISERQSFAFETVMSHPSKLEVMKQAKNAGYEVELIFVSTNDPEINVERVRQRVAEGGHDVPANKIRERYERSIELLPAAAEIADKVYIIDNSNVPKLVVRIQNAEVIYQLPDAPLWVQNTIEKLKQRSHERTVIGNNTEVAITYANIDAGKYIGTVSQVTNNYVAQIVDQDLILHDRSIIKAEFAPGQEIRIAYNDGNVTANIRPTSENQQWAESILGIATTIFQSVRQSNQLVTTSRGIEVFEGENYQLKFNRNTQTFEIFNKNELRTIASYDLTEGTVIAASPSSQDQLHWQTVRQRLERLSKNRHSDLEL